MTENNSANPFLPIDSFMTVGKPRLELAAEKLVADLKKEAIIDESHVLTVQLILDLARSAGISADKGRASAVAMVSRELREVLATLPGADKTMEQEFSEMMNKAGII